MSDKPDLCIVCGVNPPRDLPNPIPEETPVMFSEMMAERPLYCEGCWREYLTADVEPERRFGVKT